VCLGSGTGLVGIYAAALLKPKKVYLTDLDDALEIMQQNVDLMKKGSTEMIVAELAWGPKKQERYNQVDLVLLTDVLYNQSSHDLLLDTLDWLLDNKDCKALLTYKERNPDEREFFTKVNSKGWKCNRVEGDDHLVCEVYWIEKK
jgi:predicted nicotinamide N-methyase